MQWHPYDADFSPKMNPSFEGAVVLSHKIVARCGSGAFLLDDFMVFQCRNVGTNCISRSRHSVNFAQTRSSVERSDFIRIPLIGDSSTVRSDLVFPRHKFAIVSAAILLQPERTTCKVIHSERIAALGDAENLEKIDVRRIRLTKSSIGAHAVAGSFATADNYLMAWRRASKGWLTCEFEIEYLDGYILKGEYKKCRRKSGRLSLSSYIRSAIRSASTRSESHLLVIAVLEDFRIQLWQGNSPSNMNVDFLKLHEIGDLSEY